MAENNGTTGQLLAATIVAAFPRFIESKLRQLGAIDQPGLLRAIESGCASLASALDELVTTPIAHQTRSPLELVRNATQPISAALEEASAPRPQRDDQAAVLHPADVYELYPASSRELGDDVWELHMRWGIEKARDVAGVIPAPAPAAAAADPVGLTVVLYGVDRAHRDQLAAVIGRQGYRVAVWWNPADLETGLVERPLLTMVDLGHPRAHDGIRSCVASGSRVVAVGAGVDDFATAAAMALGAEEVVALDRVVDRLPNLLPRLV